MSKSKTDKHLTLSYKKTISKSDLHPLEGVGNGKIYVFKVLTDKHLTLSYKKTISKSDLHPLKGVGNGKIDVFKELTPHSRTF